MLDIKIKSIFNRILNKNNRNQDKNLLIGKFIRNRSTREVNKNAAIELEALLLHTDCIAGLYYPTVDENQDYLVCDESPKGKLPVPPQKFWHWYGLNEESYLKGGKALAQIYRESAKKHGISFQHGQKMLDFGCSGGRVLRWFEEEASKGVECWGCDIDAAAIDWTQKNLMPPFKFFVNSTAPHLPFRDDYFDFIYAGSFFTHIKDMATMWLLELARCINKDGVGIITIVDEGSLEKLRNLSKKQGDNAPRGAQFIAENNITRETLQNQGFITRDSSPWWLGTLYSRDFFIRRASVAFDVLEVRDNMNVYQSGYVLRPK
ncbi:MAG TPA: hypothetical protein DDY20_01605 [Desulfobulbaceae bacterium]|nr:hypothetical protein [Desulfobulbaceae bacterium]